MKLHRSYVKSQRLSTIVSEKPDKNVSEKPDNNISEKPDRDVSGKPGSNVSERPNNNVSEKTNNSVSVKPQLYFQRSKQFISPERYLLEFQKPHKRNHFQQTKYTQIQGLPNNNGLNPQLLQHVTNAIFLCEEKEVLKQKFLVLKNEANQRETYLEFQNKNLKRTISNYELYIQKLFLTCQNMLNLHNSSVQTKMKLDSKQINEIDKSNNKFYKQPNQIRQAQTINHQKQPSAQYLGQINCIFQEKTKQNKKISIHRQCNSTSSEIQTKIKRLESLLSIKYEHYMSARYANKQLFKDNDLQTRLEEENCQLKRQLNSLSLINSHNCRFILKLKSDYERVYKQLFSGKKQQQKERDQAQTNILRLQNQLKQTILQRSNYRTVQSQIFKAKKQIQTNQQGYNIQRAEIQKQHQKCKSLKQEQISILKAQITHVSGELKSFKQGSKMVDLTCQQNALHLQEIRNYKLISDQYTQMKNQCHQLKQQSLTVDVRFNRLQNQSEAKDSLIAQYVQRTFVMDQKIADLQAENSKLQSDYSYITKTNSELKSRCFRLQEEKENLSIQLSIRTSELNSLAESNPASKQTSRHRSKQISKGILPVQSVIVFESKIDFLEEQLFRRIKNYHRIERNNIDDLSLSDPHYECKAKQIQINKFVDELENYIDYLQKERVEVIEASNSYFAKQPSIVINMNLDSNNTLHQQSNNPKHSPIIRLEELQHNQFLRPIIYENINLSVSSNHQNGFLTKQANKSSFQILIQEQSQINGMMNLPLSPHSNNLLSGHIQQMDNFKSVSGMHRNLEYSPSTTEQKLSRNTVSKHLFENQDNGSKFSFNFLSEVTQTDKQKSQNYLKSRYDELPEINYYIERNQNFDFAGQRPKNSMQNSQIVYYQSLRNHQNEAKFRVPNDYFQSQTKRSNPKSQLLKYLKFSQTEQKISQKTYKNFSQIKNYTQL